MTDWKTGYASEAVAISADIVEESGHHWLANQMSSGTAGNRIETQIAMRALMVARGDLELKMPYFGHYKPM